MTKFYSSWFLFLNKDYVVFFYNIRTFETDLLQSPVASKAVL